MKVVDVKKISVAKFKESDAYKIAFSIVTGQFLTKKRLKMRQFL